MTDDEIRPRERVSPFVDWPGQYYHVNEYLSMVVTHMLDMIQEHRIAGLGNRPNDTVLGRFERFRDDYDVLLQKAALWDSLYPAKADDSPPQVVRHERVVVP